MARAVVAAAAVPISNAAVAVAAATGVAASS